MKFDFLLDEPNEVKRNSISSNSPLRNLSFIKGTKIKSFTLFFFFKSLPERHCLNQCLVQLKKTFLGNSFRRGSYEAWSTQLCVKSEVMVLTCQLASFYLGDLYFSPA